MPDRVRHVYIACLVAASACLSAGCHGILDVTLQGRTPAERLNSSALARTLVDGVIGDLECGWDLYVAGTSWISDEYEPTGGYLGWRNWAFRRISSSDEDLSNSTCDDAVLGMYTPLQVARYQAEDVANRLESWTELQLPDSKALLATTFAYGAYAYVALGEGFCSVSFGGGIVLPADSALARAEKRFSQAIALGEESHATDIVNMARLGRARVRLDRGNKTGAAADASLVPEGFKVLVTRGAESVRRYNHHYDLSTRQLAAAVAAYYQHLTVGGVADPRVPIAGPVLSWSVRAFFTTKYAGLSSPHRLASYEEAQYIIAEAQGGQTAVNIINALRDKYALPHFVGGTEEQIQAQIIEERRREFFAEGGIRLNDLLRKKLSWKTGVDPNFGQPYGTTTCLPLPDKELIGSS